MGDAKSLPGPVLVVATNCNGGVKEVLCFRSVPERGALWHHRCPDNAEFAGELPPLLDSVRTVHWFDPCELLRPDARSEYREEFRARAPGGGWALKDEPGSPACRGPKRAATQPPTRSPTVAESNRHAGCVPPLYVTLVGGAERVDVAEPFRILLPAKPGRRDRKGLSVRVHGIR